MTTDRFAPSWRDISASHHNKELANEKMIIKAGLLAQSSSSLQRSQCHNILTEEAVKRVTICSLYRDETKRYGGSKTSILRHVRCSF